MNYNKTKTKDNDKCNMLSFQRSTDALLVIIMGWIVELCSCHGDEQPAEDKLFCKPGLVDARMLVLMSFKTFSVVEPSTRACCWTKLFSTFLAIPADEVCLSDCVSVILFQWGPLKCSLSEAQRNIIYLHTSSSPCFPACFRYWCNGSCCYQQ